MRCAALPTGRKKLRMKQIELPVYGISIRLDEGTLHGASIKSDMHAGDEGHSHSAAIDGIEVLILGHAVAGIDIEDPAYLEGIETAVDAVAGYRNEYDMPVKTNSLTVLDEPMSMDEIRKRNRADGSIEGIIRVEMSELIERMDGCNLERFLDLISMRLTDTDLLMDTSYEIIGHEAGDTLLIKVSGDPTGILDCEDAE